MEEKKFKCEKCEMTFMLKWRLGKHMSIHKEKESMLKFCHYFNNDKSCPYANIGCMFLHKDAPYCRSKDKCSKKLCKFKHSNSVQKYQFSCEKCEKVESSDKALKKHVNEVQDIEEDKEFDEYV